MPQRSRGGQVARAAAARRNTSSGGPIQIGHERNIGGEQHRRRSPRRSAIAADRPTQSSAHHIATAKNVATVCARKPSCVNAPEKYCAGRNSSSDRGDRVRHRQAACGARSGTRTPRSARRRARASGKNARRSIDAEPARRRSPRAGARPACSAPSRPSTPSSDRSCTRWPLLLDVVDEQEVMREIGPAAGRHQRRPRQPQQRQRGRTRTTAIHTSRSAVQRAPPMRRSHTASDRRGRGGQRQRRPVAPGRDRPRQSA